VKGGRTFTRRFQAPDGSITRTEVYLRLDDLDPGDVEIDAASVSGQIGLIAELLAEVTERREEADAMYRQWRGRRLLAAAKEEGMPEWQARAASEADPRFVAFKKTLGRLKAESVFLDLYLEALQAKGARVRDRIELSKVAHAGAIIGGPAGAGRKAEARTKEIGLSRRERIAAAARRGQQAEEDEA